MKKTMRVLTIIGIAMTALAVSVIIGEETKKAVKPLRVGVYDSRCITLAYVQAGFHKNERLTKLFNQLKEAEMKGDTKSAQGIKDELSYWTRKRHSQGFGTAPVQELLTPVKDKLPGVAEQVGVDMIISKWQIDYQSKDAEMIDVTEAITRLYVSDKDAAGIMDGVKNIEPIPEEECVKIND